MGLFGARNSGLKIAKGEYIMFVDSDDYLEPNACKEAYEQIRKNDDDIVLFDRYEYVDETQTRRTVNSKLKFLNNYKTGESFHFWDIKGKFLNGTEAWYKIYKKSFLDKNKIRFPDVAFGEDVSFAWEVITKANTFSVLNKRLYNYRLWAVSMCSYSALSCWQDVFVSRHIAYQTVIHSDHKTCFLIQFLPYYINSVMYWYGRWEKIKGFCQKGYYDKMRALFRELREEYRPLLDEIQESIDDYQRFNRISDESWFLYRIKNVLQIFRDRMINRQSLSDE